MTVRNHVFHTASFAVLICAVLILSGCAQTTRPVACTADARVCPDGSAVGRVGPNCEFAACPTTNNATIPSTFKEYFALSVDECMRTRFTCGNDTAFSDETGCGCVRAHTNPEGSICTMDYNPVCGWFNTSIQCFAYPCAVTEGNRCGAAADPKVAYTTPGECPTVGTHPSNGNETGNKTYLKQGPNCVINFMCINGKQAFRDDNGCGCMDATPAPSPITATKIRATDCPTERTQACTREYMPVCGQLTAGGSTTYDNKCTACADAAVGSYYDGACPAEGSAPDGTY